MIGGGHHAYFSPERLQAELTRKPFDCEKADAWSLGLTLLEMSLGYNPLEGMDVKNILSVHACLNNIPELKDPPVDTYWVAIKGLLDLNPDRRLTPKEALSLPCWNSPAYLFSPKNPDQETERRQLAFAKLDKDVSSLEVEFKIVKSDENEYHQIELLQEAKEPSNSQAILTGLEDSLYAAVKVTELTQPSPASAAKLSVQENKSDRDPYLVEKIAQQGLIIQTQQRTIERLREHIETLTQQLQALTNQKPEVEDKNQGPTRSTLRFDFFTK